MPYITFFLYKLKHDALQSTPDSHAPLCPLNPRSPNSNAKHFTTTKRLNNTHTRTTTNTNTLSTNNVPSYASHKASPYDPLPSSDTTSPQKKSKPLAPHTLNRNTHTHTHTLRSSCVDSLARTHGLKRSNVSQSLSSAEFSCLHSPLCLTDSPSLCVQVYRVYSTVRLLSPCLTHSPAVTACTVSSSLNRTRMDDVRCR